MSIENRIADFQSSVSPAVVDSVRLASRAKVTSRFRQVEAAGDDWSAARQRASLVRQDSIDHLPELLQEFEAKATDNGLIVHWAATAESACEQVAAIIRAATPQSALIVKGKSMVTEEIHLNEALQRHGHEVVETDLGEFVVQLDGDTPSHIVTPIIHKSRADVARTYRAHGLPAESTQPEALAATARQHLREKFRRADVGISGANFLVAETGQIVIVENEGNNRLSTTAPDVHIVVAGIEKVIRYAADVPNLLRLLARSATGQPITVYTHLVQAPRSQNELDGPRQVHVVFVDNGRTRALAGPYREILKCIRCGACLNVCPVTRAATGHAYGHVYSGPLGAVFAHAVAPDNEFKDLAHASTLCGACQEVCPVAIPIPALLERIRAESIESGEWRAWRQIAERDQLWRATRSLLPMVARMAGVSVAAGPRGRDFRRWWRDRS